MGITCFFHGVRSILSFTQDRRRSLKRSERTARNMQASTLSLHRYDYRLNSWIKDMPDDHTQNATRHWIFDLPNAQHGFGMNYFVSNLLCRFGSMTSRWCYLTSDACILR